MINAKRNNAVAKETEPVLSRKKESENFLDKRRFPGSFFEKFLGN